MSPLWDETWKRLLGWTNGQAPSERLAAQLLLAVGFSDLEPSHPLGGPDSNRDAVARKNHVTWIVAVYFPRDQQRFKVIKRKFLGDLKGVAQNGAEGFVFVTNQELRLAEREELRETANEKTVACEIYHLETITALLDQPKMKAVRDQFLGPYEAPVTEEALNTKLSKLEGLTTGGDTICYMMLYDFDLARDVARQFAIIRNGINPLYDVRARVFDRILETDVSNKSFGEINSPADFATLEWPLRATQNYRITFNARNGSWYQSLLLNKSVTAECWLAATKVTSRAGQEIFRHVDGDYVHEFGEPQWEP